jgi:L-ascorbate metabolism protein UlaG (beta-lactamase superfamily)
LRRRNQILLAASGALLISAVIATVLSTDYLRAFGGSPDAARLAGSPELINGQFQNPDATSMMMRGVWLATTRHWLFGSEERAPRCPLALFDGADVLMQPPRSGLRVTWLGHSTTLIELDGAVILTDPTWSRRASPSSWVGPARFHPPPLRLENLPHVDAVVISHEHYDHLDMATVRSLAARGVPFHVPLGIGAHLRAWKVPPQQIVEHDWWQDSLVAGVRLVSTPARHFNGRGMPGRLGALWTSWSLVGPRHRVFFSGDTGLTENLRQIAAREGPFDLALLEIGQWDPSWGDIHLGPEGALEALERLGNPPLLPIHWATFQLGMHAWSEPAETLTRLAAARNSVVLTPRLGEPVELSSATSAWWRALPPIAAACP